MKNTIIFLALMFILQSCDSESKKQKVQSEKTLKSKTASIYKGKMTKPINISIDEIPLEIKYEGKIKNAVQWTDKLGDNIVITTETGIYQSSKFKHEMDGGDAEIFAYHFIMMVLSKHGKFMTLLVIVRLISSPHLSIKLLM